MPRSSNWSVPFRFSSQNSVCIYHLSHVCYMSFCLILFDFITLKPPVTSTNLHLHILHSTLFSNTINLCSSLLVQDQVSHPY
jgi:hypothetical protein